MLYEKCIAIIVVRLIVKNMSNVYVNTVNTHVLQKKRLKNTSVRWRTNFKKWKTDFGKPQNTFTQTLVKRFNKCKNECTK